MKKVGAVLLSTALLLGLSFGAVYAMPLYGFSEGSIKVIPASLNGLEWSATLNVSKTIGNKGDIVDVSVARGKAPDEFTARASTHNRSATYKLSGVYNRVIYVNEVEHNVESLSVSLSEERDYVLKGRVTYQYMCNKANAGFPKYYYRTVYTNEKTVSAKDVSNIPKEEENPPKEEKPSVIKGEIAHTAIWEERRIEKKRDENEFWPGEKFVLKAMVYSEKEPEQVRVNIEGTSYGTTLVKRGDTWEGEIAHEDMAGKWQGEEETRLEFRFIAEFQDGSCEDLKSVMIEGSEGYWILHRKE